MPLRFSLQPVGKSGMQMTKPAEIIHAGFEFGCHFRKRQVERGAVRLVGSLAYQCRLPGHLAATHCALVCTVLRGERLALAIAFVFGPDGHDVRGLHGNLSCMSV
jgi:hypothetical protein